MIIDIFYKTIVIVATEKSRRYTLHGFRHWKKTLICKKETLIFHWVLLHPLANECIVYVFGQFVNVPINYLHNDHNGSSREKIVMVRLIAFTYLVFIVFDLKWIQRVDFVDPFNRVKYVLSQWNFN